MRNAKYLTLILFTLFGCKNRNQRVIEFENALPNSDKFTLQKIVNSYDSLIKTAYNGSVDEFLIQIESNKPILKELDIQAYCELVKMYDNSTLEYKTQNVQYDTVYINKQGYIKKIMQAEDITEELLHLDEEIEVLPPFSEEELEKEIEKIKKRGYFRFISSSSFTSALKKVSTGDIEMLGYIDTKENTNYFNPEIMASAIRKSNVDVENYFYKRIIALVLFIQQIKREYGC